MLIIFDKLVDFLKAGALSIFIKELPPNELRTEDIIVLCGIVLVSLDTDIIASTSVRVKMCEGLTKESVVEELSKYWRMYPGTIVESMSDAKSFTDDSFLLKSVEKIDGVEHLKEIIETAVNHIEESKRKSPPKTSAHDIEEMLRKRKQNKLAKFTNPINNNRRNKP